MLLKFERLKYMTKNFGRKLESIKKITNRVPG